MGYEQLEIDRERKLSDARAKQHYADQMKIALFPELVKRLELLLPYAEAWNKHTPSGNLLAIVLNTKDVLARCRDV